MIALLEGTVKYTSDSSVILSVSGVGYRVWVPQKNISSALSVGKKVELFIYSHIREDAHELFGLLTAKDLELFEKIVSISGVGPKIALGIFNKGTRDEIVSAILASDVSFFTGIPRLGKKNAQKIIIELKSKVGGKTSDEIPSDDVDANYVLAALKNFGFSRAESLSAFRAITDEGQTVEQKIKMALKYLAK